jgi:hypothetical protein
VDHPASFCYKLPEGVSHEQGAMCEPLSVGVHAVRRAAIPPGADVAVIGSGPIGRHRPLNMLAVLNVYTLAGQLTALHHPPVLRVWKLCQQPTGGHVHGMWSQRQSLLCAYDVQAL